MRFGRLDDCEQQETEKYRDAKYEAENGLERFRDTVCNTLTEGNTL